MSLLDTFALMFETDAGEAADDVKKFNKEVKDTEKSAEDAGKSLDGMSDSTGDLSGALMGAAKSMVSFVGTFLAFSAIKDNIIQTAAWTDELGKLSQTFGFNITKMDAWGDAAARNGGSAESFRSTVVGLNDQLSQIQFGGGTEIVQTLGMMGVSAYNANGQLKDTFDIMEDVANVMERMDTRTSAAFGQRLGLDQGTILLLQQGRYNLQQLVEQQTQLGSATDDAYNAAANFDDSMDNLNRSFRSIWQSINTAVLPAFTWIINKINDVVTFFRENESFATGFFVAIGAAVSIYAIPPLVTLATTIWAIIAPFVAVGAAAVAVGVGIGLVFDDIANYIKGNDSLIGRLADKYEWFGDIVDGVIAGVKTAWEGMQALFDWLILLIQSPNEAIDQLKDNLLSIGQSIKDGMIEGTKNAVAWMKKEFTDLWNWIKDLFDFSFLTDSIASSFNSLKGMLTFGGKDEQVLTPQTQAALSVSNMYSTTPLNNYNSSMFNSSNRYVNDNRQFSFNNSINAQGLTAEQATGLVSDRLTSQINRAVERQNDGIDY